MKTTYQMIIEFFQTLNLGGEMTLFRACNSGVLPMSYSQAKRVVKKAQARGDIQITRAEGEQGRPLKGVSKK